MNKIVNSLEEAVADIRDRSTILVGGFANSGTPHNLIQAVIKKGAGNLTIMGNGSTEWFPFVQAGKARRIVGGFTNSPIRPEITNTVERQIAEGKLEAEAMPHGTLDERLRAGASGIAAFYTQAGIGTEVAKGKEKRIFGGKKYMLETALRGDFALVKGYQADRWGNIYCRLSATNRNLTMAMAADITIAEVEEIVELGQLDPEKISIPGIFVKRVVKAPKIVIWLVREKEKV